MGMIPTQFWEFTLCLSSRLLFSVNEILQKPRCMRVQPRPAVSELIMLNEPVKEIIPSCRLQPAEHGEHRIPTEYPEAGECDAHVTSSNIRRFDLSPHRPPACQPAYRYPYDVWLLLSHYLVTPSFCTIIWVSQIISSR